MVEEIDTEAINPPLADNAYDTTYLAGDVHQTAAYLDPDRGKWRLLYALTLMTVFLSMAVSVTAYRQGKDRAQVKTLAEGNRKVSCDVQAIRLATPPKTPLEKALDTYFKQHPVACQ